MGLFLTNIPLPKPKRLKEAHREIDAPRLSGPPPGTLALTFQCPEVHTGPGRTSWKKRGSPDRWSRQPFTPSQLAAQTHQTTRRRHNSPTLLDAKALPRHDRIRGAQARVPVHV